MKRIGILVVAYNAATTLASVLNRIPKDFLGRVEQIIVNDDFSNDSTYLVGLGFQQDQPDFPLEIIRHPSNLGYGGNQKAGYRWAIEQELDIVVLLHGDGQYPPELLAEMVAPLERDECDAVFGSRMMVKGEARRGGMPMYKYVGNRILTAFENKVVGLDLTEWHSGYRAYNVAALRDIPFESNANGFEFDTQIIVQMHEAGKQMLEIPIPTYYGDEICYVNGLSYARDVVRDVLTYRAHKVGFGSGETAFATNTYELKTGESTSHGQILRWLEHRPPARILDVGCSDGLLGERLRACGHTVVGVDITKHEGVGERLDEFYEANLDEGLPQEAGDGFDVVLAADVLEHTRRPDLLLEEFRTRLAPNGTVIASVPNFAHWYPRARVMSGRFDYDSRGILDRDHVRFFTQRSFERLCDKAGFRIRRDTAIGLPMEAAHRGGTGSQRPNRPSLVASIERAAVGLWPAMFGFQLLYELDPNKDAG